MRNAICTFSALVIVAAAAVCGAHARPGDASTDISIGTSATVDRPKPPKSVRLYVFDCGTLHPADMGRYQLRKEEVSTTDLADACFLISHPKGTLIWDTGAVADSKWMPKGDSKSGAREGPVDVHIVLPDGQKREATMRRGLLAQLAEAGYSAGMIDYLVLSHYHCDHTGNANEFAGATWLVRQVERDAMFADKLTATTDPATYSKLRDSKFRIIATDDYDVFGDGKVVIKFAPGHTPGHQVLYVKLAHTGGVVLSGDLYHYPEERALGRVPKFDFDPEQTRASRASIEEFLKQSGAQLWIQHDAAGNAKLKKSPAYYD
jgi:glyoxylase-like metal-dependent hydrolase (beta-lactamase superfamily II)